LLVIDVSGLVRRSPQRGPAGAATRGPDAITSDDNAPQRADEPTAQLPCLVNAQRGAAVQGSERDGLHGRVCERRWFSRWHRRGVSIRPFSDERGARHPARASVFAISQEALKTTAPTPS